jgi:hypothetical protein
LSVNETIIGNLRLKVDNFEPLLARLRIASLLNGARLQPAGLAPHAILYLRSVRDPLPGVLRLAPGDSQAPQAWQQKMSATLDRLAGSARRPALEYVPPGAEAVVFLDRSELLACFASDWCEGTWMTRWWWQSLLKQGTASQIVKKLWCSDPQYAPAALQQLATRKKAVDFVRTFDDAEVHQLLRSVARTFALHPLIPVLDDFTAPTTVQSTPVDTSQPKDSYRENIVRGHKSDQSLRARGFETPWSRWVPECDTPGLRPAQQLFLGLVLMLQRVPVKVRAANFQTKVRAWQQQISASDAVSLQPSDEQPPGIFADSFFRLPDPKFVESPSPSAGVGDKAPLAGTAAIPEPGASEFDAPVRSRSESIDAAALTNAERQEPRVKQPEDKRQQRDLNSYRPNAKLPTSPSGTGKIQSETTTSLQNYEQLDSATPGEVGPQEVSQPSQERDVNAQPAYALAEHLSTHEDELRLTPDTFNFETEVTEERIETQLGGLFYLINLGLFLGLYGDFTSPDDPGLELSIWDFVALVGRELVGDHLQDDPVWELLAQLAQREEEGRPGSGVEPEDDWRLPPEWLQPFAKLSSEPWQLSASCTRLRLFHPDGFVVLDIPREASPEVSLQSEFKAYESSGFRVPSFKLSNVENELETRNSKLETWLERLLPYVRARLRRALGLGATTDPGPLVCRHQARVCVTPTHLDLFFRLAELPIEIRLAGLDRNPGWVPAAGRFIAFHFE